METFIGNRCRHRRCYSRMLKPMLQTGTLKPHAERMPHMHRRIRDASLNKIICCFFGKLIKRRLPFVRQGRLKDCERMWKGPEAKHPEAQHSAIFRWRIYSALAKWTTSAKVTNYKTISPWWKKMLPLVSWLLTYQLNAKIGKPSELFSLSAEIVSFLYRILKASSLFFSALITIINLEIERISCWCARGAADSIERSVERPAGSGWVLREFSASSQPAPSELQRLFERCKNSDNSKKRVAGPEKHTRVAAGKVISSKLDAIWQVKR